MPTDPILAGVPMMRELQQRHPDWTNDQHLAEQERLAIFAFAFHAQGNGDAPADR